MLGAIAGDIIGSPYEYRNIRTTEFPLFQGPKVNRYTDDTAMTLATMSALMNGAETPQDFAKRYKFYGKNERYLDYGARFWAWLQGNSMEPYGSFGNGSAMRVSPIGLWFCKNTIDCERIALASAACTHNHWIGEAGAAAVARSIAIGFQDAPKERILEDAYAYLYPNGTEKKSPPNYVNMNRAMFSPHELIAEDRHLDETCHGAVPVAYAALALGNTWEECIRIAVSAGGDTDTICAIVGPMAEAVYGIPEDIAEEALSYLTPQYRELVATFYERAMQRNDLKHFPASVGPLSEAQMEANGSGA